MENDTTDVTKILVVDDEAAIRNVVSMLLTQAGYEVVVAEYGQVGFSKAQSVKPDLIMLDLMMPVMDGFEVLRRLKGDQRTRHIPVIILTAKIDAASERECMSLGAVDYIKKPWGPHELEDRIGMALGYPKLKPPCALPNCDHRIDAEKDDNQDPDLSPSMESSTHQTSMVNGLDESENQDTGEPRKYRTRSFRIRQDGVDPSSLV